MGRHDVVVPDLVGEIIGFRAWRVDTSSLLEGPKLVSPYMYTEWEADGWEHATCGGDTVDVPHEEHHGCGIYAAINREHLARENHNRYSYGEILVIGEVAMAGKVIEATQGWRAEKGRPLSLLLPYEYWELLEPLSRAYGVPVQLDNIERRRRKP